MYFVDDRDTAGYHSAKDAFATARRINEQLNITTTEVFDYDAIGLYRIVNVHTMEVTYRR